jgi:hypothetical protein
LVALPLLSVVVVAAAALLEQLLVAQEALAAVAQKLLELGMVVALAHLHKEMLVEQHLQTYQHKFVVVAVAVQGQ